MLFRSDQPQEVMSLAGGQVQIKIAPRERPAVMQGFTYRMRTAYGNLFVTVNEDDHGLFEVFAQMGKAGGFFSAQTEAITRLISLALRSNIAAEEIIEQLKGIRGPEVSFSDGQQVFSLPDAVGKILDRHVNRNNSTQPIALDIKTNIESKLVEPVLEQVTAVSVSATGSQFKQQTKVSIANLGNAPVCATCGGMLVFAEGCMKCESCGYSKCG